MFDAIGSAVCRNLEYSIHTDEHTVCSHPRTHTYICKQYTVQREYLHITTTNMLVPKNDSLYIVVLNRRTIYIPITIRLVTDFFRTNPSRIPVSSWKFRIIRSGSFPDSTDRIGAHNSPGRLLQNYSKNWFPPFDQPTPRGSPRMRACVR